MRVERFLTKADVEATLQLHRNTLTRLLSKGYFPRAFRTGGRWRIPVGDVQRFVANGGRPEAGGQDKGVRGGQ